ncbi:RNA-directed DNA polymerase [Candidatus Uhrbacteria bacterium]|nr:RNA-directed DNA polymerase [Candidatus Uhrbacteria bacterium]
MAEQSRLPISFLLDARLEEVLCQILKIDPAEWRATTALWASGNAWTIHKIPKKKGHRTIHAPSDPLKKVLRALLTQFIQGIPVHLAVHGAHPGTSIVTNARAHVGGKAFYLLDLKDAFPTVNRKRCSAIFGPTFTGYITVVTGLPEQDGKRLAETFVDLLIVDDVLPQGFPTSPAVLNVLLGQVDRNISQLLRSASATEGVVYKYTRFVDDLTISSSDEVIPKKLRQKIRQAVRSDGWTIQGTKVSYFGDGAEGDEERTTKYPEVTGIIPNQDGRLTIPRPRLNKFRAILHNLLEVADKRQSGDEEALKAVKAQMEKDVVAFRKRGISLDSNLSPDKFYAREWPLTTREHRLLVGIVGFVSMVYDQKLPSSIRELYIKAKTQFRIGTRDISQGHAYSFVKETE